MTSNIENFSASPQLKTLIIPCSRCKNCQKIEFLEQTRVFVECTYYKLDEFLADLVKKTRICEYYCESIENLRANLNNENFC